MSLFQIRSLDAAIAEAVGIVQEAKVEHRPSRTFLCYSGGNDSQVLLHLLAPLADEIVHVDTGIGIPEVAPFCRATAGAYPIPYTELSPPRSYESLVFDAKDGWNGLPGAGIHHHVYSRLKERCFEEVLRRHRTYRGERFMLLSGIRRAESARRSDYDRVNRKGGQVWVNPLYEWPSDEMADYRRRFEVPVSEVAANLHMSGECLCGAMASQGPERAERAQIKFFYPDFDARLSSIERECERRGLLHCEWGVKRGEEPSDSWSPACQSCQYRFELNESVPRRVGKP